MPGLRLLPLLLVLTSCWRYDPLYCDEQSDCADNPGLTFCDENGAFPASNGIARTCIPDPGGTCTTPADCADPLLPACVGGVCRACDATHACSPAAPVCDQASSTCGDCRTDDDCAAFSDQKLCGADGACVGCRDDNDCDAGSACDDETQQCTGCTQDSDCDSGLCNEGPPGVCVAEANILYVTATGSGTDCTKAAPCGTIAQAHQRVTGLRTYILLGPGAYDGGELRDKGFSMYGAGASVITPLALQGEISIENVTLRATLTISGTAPVSIRQLHVAGASVGDSSAGAITIEGAPVRIARSNVERTTGGSGIIVRSGSVELTDSVVTTSSLYGVGLQGDGTSTIRRSTIIANGTIGVLITSPRYSVTNSVIANNGYMGVYLGSSPNEGQIEHNTIVGNRTSGEDAGGIRCDGAATTYRNNIFFNNGTNMARQQVSGCAVAHSVFWPHDPPSGAGNVKADPLFADPATNDFHIGSSSPARRAADPNRARTSPAVIVTDDFDGQPRAASGQADIGADEYSP
jgi:parallel beta-helix repeat protein